MKQRVIQLMARYLAVLLTGWGFTNVEDTATTIATGAVAFVLLMVDLCLHKRQQVKQ